MLTSVCHNAALHSFIVLHLQKMGEGGKREGGEERGGEERGGEVKFKVSGINLVCFSRILQSQR